MRSRLAMAAAVLVFTSLVPELDAAPAWNRVRSRNFVVVGDAGAGAARDVAFRLEQQCEPS